MSFNNAGSTRPRRWAKGIREELVLKPMLEYYIGASLHGVRARRRALERICHRYHFQIPPSTPAYADIHAPLPRWTPEVEYDLFEGCSTFVKKSARRNKLMEENRRIARWFAYRDRRARGPDV
ncbi:hypothetical protein GGG16DRAFT_119015 [Schizophyllum commune]